MDDDRPMIDDGSTAGSMAPVSRRRFLRGGTRLLVAGGLAASAGWLLSIAVRFLLPRRGPDARWQFVALERDLQVGQTMAYLTPAGAPVNVTRLRAPAETNSFAAFSSICPHLGCRVHWEAHHKRFFCPCHDGVFDSDGRARAGPPYEEGLDLTRFPLRLERGALFIHVVVDKRVL